MKELKKNIISMCGDEGKQWLDSLPEITAKIAEEHNLSSLTPVTNILNSESFLPPTVHGKYDF